MRTKQRGLAQAAAGALMALCAAVSPAGAGAPTVGAANPGSTNPGSTNPGAANPGAANAAATLTVTPALVRQMQFMLSTIGIDPGPIDGVPRQLTNAAVRKFEQQAGLPAADLVDHGQVPAALLERLRKAVSAVLIGVQPPAPAAAPPPAVPQPPPAAQRFAACPYAAADFLIGGTQYTPDSFLQTGFGGSVKTAVDSLADRLKEAQQVAQQIGGPALAEVQRQARVLAYFQCRLKIEEGAAGRN